MKIYKTKSVIEKMKNNSQEENETTKEKIIRISNQITIGTIPLVLGVKIANDNSVQLSYLEKTLSKFLTVPGYLGLQAMVYGITISAFGIASYKTFKGIEKLFKE